MSKPKGQPTKRPRAIAGLLLCLMESFPEVPTRRDLLSNLKLAPTQVDNILRRLTQEGIVSRSGEGFAIRDHENAESGAVGYVFQSEGLGFSMAYHGRPPPPLPDKRGVRPVHLGQYLPRLVWSPWNRYLVHREHFFMDRVAMMYARIFVGSQPHRSEDFVLIPELRTALQGPNPVAAVADALLHRSTVLERLTAPALADWRRKFRIALQVSPNFYRHSFDVVPYGGIRFDGHVVHLRELSGDMIIEAQYWAGDEWSVHPAAALVRLVVERLAAQDYITYVQTRQALARLAPRWKPKVPTPTELGKAQRIL